MRQPSTNTRNRKGGSSSTGRGKSAGKRSTSSRTQGNSSSRGSSGRTQSNSNQRGNSLSATGARANRQAAGSRSSGASKSGSYLEKFFTDQLKDIYYAEQRLAQGLAKMRDAATTEELRDAFEDHMHLTERHARRLEKIFESLGMRPEGKRCEAVEGIIKEVETIINETEEGTATRDAALIMGAQKAEHYEIATYGGLVTFAITMGLFEQADRLDKTLIEEEETDLLLTDIAENYINLAADQEGSNYMEEEEEEEMSGEAEGEAENKNKEAGAAEM